MLESSLFAIGGVNSSGAGAAEVTGSDFPGGIDPGISGDGPIASGGSSGGGAGGGGVGGTGKVTATERTKTVFACLFEALGPRRATREVARVLCALSAGMAEAIAAAAVAAVGGGSEEWGAGAVLPLVPAIGAVAPRALLPVLASLPERCADVVGLALEVLETGQAAADALARQRGVDANWVVVFGSKNPSGRWACMRPIVM